MTEPNATDREPETLETAAPTVTGSPTVTGAPTDMAAAAAPDAAVEAPAAGLAATPAADAAMAADAATLERRAFVRRMGSDAVRTAGTVFNLSRILTRTAAVAGQTVIGELERIQASGPSADSAAASVAAESAPGEPALVAEASVAPASSAVATAPDVDSEAPPPAAEPVPTPAAEPPPPAPIPLRIDDEQRAILETASSAVIAVNRAGHPPQLTTAAIHWDGEVVRFLTLGWSRRTTMLRTDSRIGLLIDEPGGPRFVTVTGQARIADGREARPEAWPMLRAELGDDADEAAVEARWQELVTADIDRAVIVVEPDQVLSGRR